jgi:hypothetical protein
LIAPEPTGVTKVGGAYLVAHGADTMGTSMAELVSGEHQEKLFHRAIRAGVGTVTENEAVATGAVIASEVGSLGVGIGVARGMAGAVGETPAFVNLASPKRTAHILTGDGTGGGHLWPGLPGKTPFPQSWSGEKVMHHVSDIASDPSLQWVQQTGRAGS